MFKINSEKININIFKIFKNDNNNNSNNII